MKGTFSGRQYRDNQNNDRFVYIISGTAEELDAYKSSQGQYYIEGDKVDRPNEFGKPLWRAYQYSGEDIIVAISKNNKVYADMSELRKQASFVKQLGGNLGDSLANKIAAQFMGGTTKAPQQPDNTEHTPSADDVAGL